MATTTNDNNRRSAPHSKHLAARGALALELATVFEKAFPNTTGNVLADILRKDDAVWARLAKVVRPSRKPSDATRMMTADMLSHGGDLTHTQREAATTPDQAFQGF